MRDGRDAAIALVRARVAAGQEIRGFEVDRACRDVLVAPFNDLDAARRLLAKHHSEVAAVILEPLQRSLRPEPGFLGSPLSTT